MMSDDDARTTHSWREPLLAFTAVVVALIAATLLSTLWGPLATNLLAVAAIVFLGIPYLILRRRGADFARFGIDFEHIPLRQIGLGLAVTVIVFPLFALGNHVWETSIQERDFEPSADHYLQWPVELEVPSLAQEPGETIQVRTTGNRLHLEWSEMSDSSISASADRAFYWTAIGALSATPADSYPPDNRWRVDPVVVGGDGRLVLSADAQTGDAELPRRLTLDFALGANADPDIFVGSRPHQANEPIELKRNYWWLLLWAATHLILIALPEEYFYRGYLQTRFADLLGESDGPRTILGFSRANWLTSGFFALGHILIPVGGAFSLARGAVFFPSLIFGWLRDRTGSIIAPIIFHAGANMMVVIVAVHYF